MNMKSLFAMSAIALASVGAQASNLITNGSFETPAIPDPSYTTLPGLLGWTAGVNGIELRNNVAGTAHDPSNYVELDTTANSTLWQDVTITTGGSYLLSFWYNSRPDNFKDGEALDNDTNTLAWSFGGKSGKVLEDYTTVTGWTHFTKTFTLTADSTETLLFAAAGADDSFGGSLDDVSLTAVPEPESYAMMIAGLGLMGAIARRRKQRKG